MTEERGRQLDYTRTIERRTGLHLFCASHQAACLAQAVPAKPEHRKLQAMPEYAGCKALQNQHIHLISE